MLLFCETNALELDLRTNEMNTIGAPEDGKVLKSKCCGLVYDYTHTA